MIPVELKDFYRAGVALQKNVPIVLEMTTFVSASWHFVINLLLRVKIPCIIGQFSHDPGTISGFLKSLPVLLIEIHDIATFNFSLSNVMWSRLLFRRF